MICYERLKASQVDQDIHKKVSAMFAMCTAEMKLAVDLPEIQYIREALPARASVLPQGRLMYVDQRVGGLFHAHRNLIQLSLDENIWTLTDAAAHETRHYWQYVTYGEGRPDWNKGLPFDHESDARIYAAKATKAYPYWPHKAQKAFEIIRGSAW